MNFERFCVSAARGRTDLSVDTREASSEFRVFVCGAERRGNMESASDRLGVLHRQLASAQAASTLQEWMCHDNHELRKEMLEFLKVSIKRAWLKLTAPNQTGHSHAVLASMSFMWPSRLGPC